MTFQLLSLFGLSINAQNKKIIFEHLSIDNGLSQGTVKGILQDEKGFMWFATHDGLNRFDGYNFKVFRNDGENKNSIGGSWIEAMDLDVKGDLWIAHSEGFSKYEKESESFVNYTLNDFKSPKTLGNYNRAFSIYCDKVYKQNIIWLGVECGVIRYDVDNKFLEHIDLYKYIGNSDYIKTIAQEKSGDIWLGTNRNTVLKLERKTNSVKIYGNDVNNTTIFDKGNINKIFIDRTGEIWIGTNRGIYKLNREKDLFESVGYLGGVNVEYKRVVSAAEDGEGIIYFGTSEGLMIYDKKKNHTNVFETDEAEPNTISAGAVISLFVDNSKVLWIGSNGNGIDLINPAKNNFDLFSYKKGVLKVRSIRTFCEDANGSIWIGGYSGLNKFDPKTNRFEYYLDKNDPRYSAFNQNIYSLCIDREKPGEIIWIGTEGGGLIKFNIITGRAEQIPYLTGKNNSTNGAVIAALYDDGKGNLWIGTENGLNVYSKSKNTFSYLVHDVDNPNSIGANSVIAIYEDSSGNLWVGTDRGGLNLFDKTKNTFTRFMFNPDDKQSISSNVVMVIFEDSDGNLWIGTAGNGLNLFDRNKKTFKRFTTREGLSNNVIYGILEDGADNLWLSTNAGLCKFNRKTFMVRNYNVHDGLQSNEFNFNAYFKSSQGKMFFGGINGFNSFYPHNIVENKFIPPVVITDFHLFNRRVAIDENADGDFTLYKSIVETDTIELSHKQNIFSFEFAALNYASPQLNKYAYKLEGFDENWNYIGSKRIANYTNIDPGVYTFKVKASNNDGIWNEEGRSITVIIDPPYWATWWFKLFGIITFGILMYGLYEFRIVSERKRNEVLELEVEQRTEELRIANEMLRHDALKLEEANNSKDKLFSIISHDLKNPFQSLLGYTEWLLEDYNNFSDDDKRKIITNICEASVNIYNLLVRLLEWSRLQSSRVNFEPVKIDLKALTDSIIKILRVSLDKKQISVVNEIDYNIFVHADENMLNSTIQNLITNAIKYSYENSVIIVSMIANEEFVAVSVEDSGVGIPEKVIPRLFKTDSIHSTRGTNNEIGTGFGLLLCKEMVERNGGTIWVESVHKKGSTFKFTVPRAKV